MEGERPPFDPATACKIPVIRGANNLSDKPAEFAINDHLSFVRFLELSRSDRVLEARPVPS